MADFSLGSNGTGHLEVTQNWNSSTQVSYHVKLWVTVTGGAFHGGPGPTWSGNMGGVTNSGGWSYPGSGTRNYTLWEFDHTYNKDANGNLTLNFSGSINGDNSPFVGSNSTNFNMSPSRIGVAPTMNNPVASDVSIVTATISGSAANNGLGTSTTVYLRYKKTSDGSWTELSAGSPKNLTGLTPATQYQFQVRGVNNNGDDSGYVNTQTFTTLPAPGMSAPLLGILGIM